METLSGTLINLGGAAAQHCLPSVGDAVHAAVWQQLRSAGPFADASLRQRTTGLSSTSACAFSRPCLGRRYGSRSCGLTPPAALASVHAQVNAPHLAVTNETEVAKNTLY